MYGRTLCITIKRNVTKIQCIDQIKFKQLIRRQKRIRQQIIPKMQREKKILRLSDQLSISKRMLANFFKDKHTSKDYFSFVLLHFVQDHKKK